MPHSPLQDLAAKGAVWLFVRDPAKLDEQEQAQLSAVCQASETATTTYQLVQPFRRILRQRERERAREQLEGWLEAVKASQIRELQSFVLGIERDKTAVVTGLALPYSNGLVEGKVNKLKRMKRMGYGRAALPLLRQRMLHAL